MTTLGHEPLLFVTENQKIVDKTGRHFQHPLAKTILDMVVKCSELGGGDMITLDVPFNEATRVFDWKMPHPTLENANL